MLRNHFNNLELRSVLIILLFSPSRIQDIHSINQKLSSMQNQINDVVLRVEQTETRLSTNNNNENRNSTSPQPLWSSNPALPPRRNIRQPFTKTVSFEEPKANDKDDKNSSEINDSSSNNTNIYARGRNPFTDSDGVMVVDPDEAKGDDNSNHPSFPAVPPGSNPSTTTTNNKKEGNPTISNTNRDLSLTQSARIRKEFQKTKGTT